MNTMQKRSFSLYDKARVAAVLAMLSPFAMAQAADFDGSTIIAKVVTYTAVGVAILAAFALGRWTLKALGLIGGK